MALYVIGDTHLSLSSDKPMDVFGGGWRGYVEKLKEGFETLTEEDTVVLCGDLSWGMSLEEAKEDFAYLNALPGKKLLMKGNHDYWWSTAAKFQKFCAENGFADQYILNNNFYEYGDYAICGTRGSRGVPMLPPRYTRCPAASSMLAHSLAEMGSRGRALRS